MLAAPIRSQSSHQIFSPRAGFLLFHKRRSGRVRTQETNPLAMEKVLMTQRRIVAKKSKGRRKEYVAQKQAVVVTSGRRNPIWKPQRKFSHCSGAKIITLAASRSHSRLRELRHPVVRATRQRFTEQRHARIQITSNSAWIFQCVSRASPSAINRGNTIRCSL